MHISQIVHIVKGEFFLLNTISQELYNTTYWARRNPFSSCSLPISISSSLRTFDNSWTVDINAWFWFVILVISSLCRFNCWLILKALQTRWHIRTLAAILKRTTASQDANGYHIEWTISCVQIVLNLTFNLVTTRSMGFMFCLRCT